MFCVMPGSTVLAAVPVCYEFGCTCFGSVYCNLYYVFGQCITVCIMFLVTVFKQGTRNIFLYLAKHVTCNTHTLCFAWPSYMSQTNENWPVTGATYTLLCIQFSIVLFALCFTSDCRCMRNLWWFGHSFICSVVLVFVPMCPCGWLTGF